MQECFIADSTATSKIVLWSNHVNKFKVNSSGLQVRTYQQQKYLSLSRDDFSMTIITDIGNVTVFNTNHQNIYKLLHHLKHACNSKVVSNSDLLAACSRCQTIQVLTKCKHRYSARVDIKTNHEIKTITIFSPLLDKFCNGKVTTETLLLHEPFNITVSDSVASFRKLTFFC